MTCGDKLFNIVGESAYNMYSAWWILLGSSCDVLIFILKGKFHVQL